MMKSETDSVVSDVLGQKHLHAIIEQVGDMLRTICHTVIKANSRFAFLSPRLGGLRATYDVHFRLVEKRVVDFLLVLTELFC